MNPIFILWAHPRPMTTAVEPVMRERRELDCRHQSFYDRLAQSNLTRAGDYDSTN